MGILEAVAKPRSCYLESQIEFCTNTSPLHQYRMSSSASTSNGLAETITRTSSQSSLSEPTAPPERTPDVPIIQEDRDLCVAAGWNTYLDWDLPDLSYQEVDSAEAPAADLIWYAGGTANMNNARPSPDSWLSMEDVSGDRPYSTEPASNSGFQGLQSLYSNEARGPIVERDPAHIRPQLSGSSHTSYDADSFTGESQLTDRAEGVNAWSPDASPVERAVNDEPLSWASPKTNLMANVEELEPAQNILIPEDHGLDSSTKAKINKKRKIAHSVIEKNYRSRINTGLAELRHCVPSMLKGDFPLNLDEMDGIEAAEEAPQSHSSGKVGILSDAVHYVKTLELQNKSLCGKLDVLQRRHDLLQKIALSKMGDNTPPTETAVQDLDSEEHQPTPEAFSDLKTRKRRKKPPPGRARSDRSADLAVRDSTGLQRDFPGNAKTMPNMSSIRTRYGGVMNLAMVPMQLSLCLKA